MRVAYPWASRSRARDGRPSVSPASTTIVSDFTGWSTTRNRPDRASIQSSKSDTPTIRHLPMFHRHSYPISRRFPTVSSSVLVCSTSIQVTKRSRTPVSLNRPTSRAKILGDLIRNHDYTCDFCHIIFRTSYENCEPPSTSRHHRPRVRRLAVGAALHRPENPGHRFRHRPAQGRHPALRWVLHFPYHT